MKKLSSILIFVLVLVITTGLALAEPPNPAYRETDRQVTTTVVEEWIPTGAKYMQIGTGEWEGWYRTAEQFEVWSQTVTLTVVTYEHPGKSKKWEPYLEKEYEFGPWEMELNYVFSDWYTF